MQTVDITINKAQVLDEVAKLTAYTGAKAMTDQDTGAYERIAVTDADRDLLERYWAEACASVTEALKRWLFTDPDTAIGHHPDISDDYVVMVSLPNRWSENEHSAVTLSLVSYMANLIAGNWFMATAPEKAQGCAAIAGAQLEQAVRSLYFKRAPKRPNV